MRPRCAWVAALASSLVSKEGFVEIYRVATLNAEMVRSVLEGNGIDCIISGSGMSGVYPGSALDSAGVLVRSKDEARARELIEQVVRGDFALKDDELPEGSEEAD
jgi:Putative prokaryotic signal transducing protein